MLFVSALYITTIGCIVTGNTDTPLPDIGTETQSTVGMGTNKGLMSYVHRWTGY